MSRVCVERLEFAYGESKVLTGISFEIKEGEILGILGPNASGKTTLLKNVAGLLTPLSGNISLEGRLSGSLSAKERSQIVAYVPQSEEPFLDFSVEQIVMMGRAPYLGLWGFEEVSDRRKVREAMERTSTWDLRKRGIEELSGGERQRVVLARALAQEAKILILDEPTSHLDVRHQKETLDLCASLAHEKSLSILLTLHDLNLASLYCDRLLLLKQGRIAYLGKVRETLTAANLKDVFGLEMQVLLDSKSGLPSCVPMR